MVSKYDIPISSEQLRAQKRYFFGACIDLLYKRDAGYEFLYERIQSLICQIGGLSSLLGNPPQLLTMMSCLEDAKLNDEHFRKDVLDAAHLIDALPEEVDVHV